MVQGRTASPDQYLQSGRRLSASGRQCLPVHQAQGDVGQHVHSQHHGSGPEGQWLLSYDDGHLCRAFERRVHLVLLRLRRRSESGRRQRSDPAGDLFRRKGDVDQGGGTQGEDGRKPLPGLPGNSDIPEGRQGGPVTQSDHGVLSLQGPSATIRDGRNDPQDRGKSQAQVPDRLTPRRPGNVRNRGLGGTLSNADRERLPLHLQKNGPMK